MVESPVRARPRHAGCVALVALLVGVGLITMHAGLSGPGGFAQVPPIEHQVNDGSAGSDASCHGDGCSSDAAMTMLCTVLLVAAAGSVAVHVWRRRLLAGPGVHALLASTRRAWREVSTWPMKPPDLHALQVMRC